MMAISYRFGIVFLIILIIISSIVVYSAYREKYSLDVKGYTYILDLKIDIISLKDYGVISIYLASEGGFAYGITVLKDPDEKYPHLYVMAGDQGKWFDAGYINISVLRFRIIFDRNTSKTVFISYSYNSTFNLDFTPMIKKLYISVFNITGRRADYPSIYIDFIRVYVYNESLNELNNTIYDLNKTLNKTLVLEISNKGINYEPYEELNPEIFTPNNIDILLLVISTIVLIVICISIIILVISYMGRVKRGSPGP